MIAPEFGKTKQPNLACPKRKASGQWKASKYDKSGKIKNMSINNIKTSGKVDKKPIVKKRLRIYPEQSFRDLIGRGSSKEKRDFSVDQSDRWREVDDRPIDTSADRILCGVENRLDKRRGCSSLDMGYHYQVQQKHMADKLNLPVFMPRTKISQPQGDFNAASSKKTFTQQSTVTGNKALSSLEEQKANKDITERLAELFNRIEKEEGETEEVSSIKKDIQTSFKIGSEGPKTTLHYYRILKLLGKGSFGKVYMASQVLTNRVVAIKCLDKKVMKEESRKNKIMHELLMFKTLAGHPNVIQIYEVFENRKYFFFVMEYASGGDLLHLMKKKGRLSESQARNIFVQLIRGLKFIHSKRILHRDIKLDNVLLTDNDGELKAKICDFGVSRNVGDGEVINEQCGTPAYIAPEIIKKKGYKDFGADIWSLGVLLYAMVMGAMPFKANDIDGLHQKIKDRDCDMSDDQASDEVKDLLERMLTVDPMHRITLSQVISHPWLLDDPQHKTIVDDSKDLISNPEEFVVHKIVRYGFPTDHVLTSVKGYSLNHAFACYMTLSKDFQ